MGSKRGTDNLLESLQLSIASGDEGQAKMVAALLAKKRVVIDMDMPLDRHENLPKNDDIMIKVYVEDRTSSSCIAIRVKKSARIKDLKLKMMKDYGFPPQVQRWIIGKRLPSDNDTLHKLGVKTPDSPLFLYLFPAKKQGLTKEDFVKQYYGDLPKKMQDKHFKGMQKEDEDGGYHEALEAAGVVEAAGGARPKTPVTPATAEMRFPEVSIANYDDNEGADEIHVSEELVGWQCPQCTFINLPTRPGCAMCSASRPEDYSLPADYEPTGEERVRLQRLTAEEQEAQLVQSREHQQRHIDVVQNFARLVEIENMDLVPNREEFDCPICFEIIEPGEGVVLRECLHSFCKDCLADAVKFSEEPTITCPHVDGDASCAQEMQEREIKALVTPDIYQKYLQRGLSSAESQAENSYHCKTPNCSSWCIYEDEVNTFQCPVCGKANCLTCKAIHEGMNCKQYQEDLAITASNDVAARQTKQMLETLVQSGEAMHCPKCRVILQKKAGCDWLRCTMCKTEVCWVTKQARWGPGGSGDTSGGCRCRVNGQLCHPNCGNCH